MKLVEVRVRENKRTIDVGDSVYIDYKIHDRKIKKVYLKGSDEELPKIGSIGDFKGQQTSSGYLWIRGKPIQV